MEEQLVIYLMILLMFIAGVIYHFRIRKQCIYTVKLTKPRVVILMISSLVFLGMAYYVGKKSWSKYPLAILGSMFIISGAVGEGISERGIYYHPLGGRYFARLVKWEDIKDIRIDVDKNKLKSFKFKNKTKFIDQYYSSKDIDEINKYTKMKIKSY